MLEGRFNIGLLVANITDDFSNGISKGAMREAKKLNADLTIIPGKYLGLEHRYEDIDARYEYQYNLLFDHAAAAKFDYIIAAVGTIAYALSSEKKREFLEKFRDTPLLCVAADIEGFDCLQFDNKSGVRCAIDYLAAQGKKHIAMMSGDPNSSDCCERFEAYKEGLAANGLEYDPQLVMESDVSAYCLDEAKKLIESAPQTDAVICVNDAVAAVVCQVLQEKGKRIGPDVAVVGFDDLPSSAQMSPPLASVKADAEIMGEAAVKIAVNRLRGVEDNELLIPTKFIPRQSSYAKDEAFNGLDSVFIGDQGDIKRKMAEYISGLELDSEPAHEITEFSIGLYEHICENYLSGEITPEILRSTKKLIDEQLPRLLLSHSAVAALFDLIDSVYEWTAEQNHGENIRQIREIHDHIYKQLCVIISVGQKVIQDRFVMRSHMDNIFIRDTLMVDDDLKESYAKIMRRLCDVGALTGYLYIFDEPIIHRLHQSFPDNVTWNFKSYNYGGVTFTVDEQEQKMQTPQVFCNKYLAAERQHTFVAADLYSAEYQYGMALLEPRDESFFDELEMVTYQLSLAVRQLHSAGMAAESLRRQDQLLQELHSRNLALEELSKIDELTDVYNRRGFYLAAGDHLSANPQLNNYIVCYADMDNLKTVNDNYGHNEGDICIKLVAQCLQEVLGEKAIIGRMGGDEFAAILPVTDGLSPEVILERKQRFTDQYELIGNKPYRFDISMGVIKKELRSSYDLKAAVDRADDLLYVDKSRKKKAQGR